MQFSFILPIDWTLPDVIIPGQSGPGSDGNEGVLGIPQSSSIIGTSRSDCLVSFPANSLECVCVCGVGGSYTTAKKQTVYSTVPVD